MTPREIRQTAEDYVAMCRLNQNDEQCVSHIVEDLTAMIFLQEENKAHPNRNDG